LAESACISAILLSASKAADVKKEQKKRLLKAKIAVAIQDETGKAPTEEQINQVFFLSRVMWKAVLGLHYERKKQKEEGQLAIF
jgi:hypothetical protein